MSHKNQPPYFPNNKKQLVSTQTSITHISSSPIPSAEELAKYEAVKPGMTDIILSTYQKQVEHRINIENSVIKHKNMNTTIGQVFAFIIAMTAIIAGYMLIKIDKNVIGLGSIITALVGLVVVFIYGRSQERKERIEKAKQVPEIK